MKKLCYVATIPAAVNAFLRGPIKTAKADFEVTVICNPFDKHLLDGLGVNILYLPIERKPSPWRDLQVLLRLVSIFRCEHFDIVHSIIPKTGLLAMLAAWLTRVPVRIHTFTGQVWVTQHGFKRILLKKFDQVIGCLATCVLADSQSQLNFLEQEAVLPAGKGQVIGAGSVCGVDLSRFRPDTNMRQTIRHELGIAQHAIVILFVGRLNRDKGMLDLAVAFDAIAKQHKGVVLLLVGAEEDVPLSSIRRICHSELDRLRYVSFTPAPEAYMMAADIYCLPSYREGFGMTIIEAAACGLPTVGTRIYGVVDAVKDGETGLLFAAGDVNALTQTLLGLISNHELRQEMGNAARARAVEAFSSEAITKGMLSLYSKLLHSH